MRRPYYRRDRKKWFVKTDDGGSSQIYLGETKAEAFAVWESMRRQGEPGRWRIAELAAAFLADAEARGVSKSYLHSCRFALGKLAAAFPNKLAADLRPSDVTAWIARQSTWGDWQRGHAIQAIRSAWRFGVSEGHLAGNPFMSLRKPMGKRKEAAITAEEHWRLLLACRCWDECAFIHALWLTGARPAELTQATAADVDGGRLVVAQHKTARKGKRRTIYLGPSAKRLVAKQCRTHPKGPIFPHSRGGQWATSGWADLFQRLAKRTGIQHAQAYSYRRGAAVRWLAAGLSVEDVAGLLGNTTTVTLAHYADLSRQEERLERAAGRG